MKCRIKTAHIQELKHHVIQHNHNYYNVQCTCMKCLKATEEIFFSNKKRITTTGKNKLAVWGPKSFRMRVGGIISRHNAPTPILKVLGQSV